MLEFYEPYSNYRFFFFNDTATTEIYTLSLHDALPISPEAAANSQCSSISVSLPAPPATERSMRDRKSTRLNSSHVRISYAVFCLKKKKKKKKKQHMKNKKKKKKKN